MTCCNQTITNIHSKTTKSYRCHQYQKYSLWEEEVNRYKVEIPNEHKTDTTACNRQRWSPRGRGLDLEAPRGRQLSALALKLKSLALVLEPKSLVLALASAFILAYLIKEQGIERTVMASVQRNK